MFLAHARCRGGHVLLRLAAGILLVALVAGCGGGGGGTVYVDEGYLFVWNHTNVTTYEWIVDFGVGPAGYPVTTGWLPGGLPPGSEAYVGAFVGGYYDAVAFLEFGSEVTFLDVFLGYQEDTVLEVF